MNKLLTDVPVSNQNLKFDLKILCLAGIEVRHIQHDTLLSSYWLDGDTTPHDLESLAAIHLRQFAHKHEMKAALRKLKGYAQLEQVPVQTLVDYACGDADKTWQLTGVMERRLVEQGTLPGYRALVLDQILPMSDMELRGVRVDRTVLDASLLTFRRALDDFEIWFNSTPLAAMFAAHLEQRGLVTKKRPAKFRPAASGDLRFLLYADSATRGCDQDAADKGRRRRDQLLRCSQVPRARPVVLHRAYARRFTKPGHLAGGCGVSRAVRRVRP